MEQVNTPAVVTQPPAASKLPGKKKRKNWELFIIALPLMILVLMFSYVPLCGWIISLFEYKPGRALFDCRYVGLKYFQMFLTDRDVYRVLKNTVIFSGIGYLLSPLPMLFALGLNEIGNARFKKVAQTTTTLPYFISMIIVYSLAFAMFSSDGVLNTVLKSLGGAGNTNLLMNKKIVYLFQTCITQWKNLGWNAIIYIAAIAGIDQEQYEAAMIDGAGRFRCALHITLPGIMPTFLVLFLLSIAHFVSTGFEQYFVFKNPIVASKIEVLDLYIYNMGLKLFDYSYSTAVGIIKSAISVVLLFAANTLAKRVRGTAII
ncbi:MAG: sugar ABC transporter permease [Clostridiales bacterium]|jgi:putative aldouronate transport system permease protein|nr:sugar ABC transporter permease [Clostridiales bacterium]